MFNNTGGLPKLPTFQPVAPRRLHELHSGTAHGAGKMINLVPMVCKTLRLLIRLGVEIYEYWCKTTAITLGYKAEAVLNQLSGVEMLVRYAPIS